MNKEAHYNHLHATGQLKGLGFWKKSKMRREALKEMPIKRKVLIYSPAVTIAVVGSLIIFLV